MTDVYVVRDNTETLASIAKTCNTTLAKLFGFNPKLKADSKLQVGDRVKIDWTRYRLRTPLVVAVAKDSYLTATTPFPDAANLPGVRAPAYGQDLAFGYGRAAPGGQDVGKTPADLKPKMEKLLKVFASQDQSGMAQRLFTAFLSKQSGVTFFADRSLDTAASKHANIADFCDLAMSAPNLRSNARGKVRIHQALQKAGWDIHKMAIPSDLGAPAFNIGSKEFQSGDFSNGLGVMINGVQYAYALATDYDYDEGAGRYKISLKFIFYDVFGLDDDDLKEFGAKSDGILSSSAAIGITAWWQLQHQHGHAPLVTRVIVEKDYEVPTK